MTSENAPNERIAQLEEKLAQEVVARQDAEAAARAALGIKQQFLASMSHELRTPLNGLIGISDLALQTQLPADAREYLLLIHRSSLALLDVLNGILDLARLESGQLVLQSAGFDVNAALAATVARYAPLAAGKRLALHLAADTDRPLHIMGDELRFCQVVDHLVGNAIKFSDRGEVTVAAHCRQSENGRCDLTISVRDTGPGVRPEDLERIFTMFTQADGSASRAYAGTGLGLALCQGLARLMGGTLGVSSVLGRGSTFIFRVELPLCGAGHVPLRRSSPVGLSPVGPSPVGSSPVAAVPAAGADGSLPSDCPVLLVEDNAVNRTLALRILEKSGCRVDQAENGAVAVQMARERAYAAIFMDLQMPVMDGLQATRLIRDEEGDGFRVPIIAVTANAMPGDREACLRAGMDDYLAKPLRPGDLQTALQRWCATVPQPA